MVQEIEKTKIAGLTIPTHAELNKMHCQFICIHDKLYVKLA